VKACSGRRSLVVASNMEIFLLARGSSWRSLDRTPDHWPSTVSGTS
jgi:hypothetical protein